MALITSMSPRKEDVEMRLMHDRNESDWPALGASVVSGMPPISRV